MGSVESSYPARPRVSDHSNTGIGVTPEIRREEKDGLEEKQQNDELRLPNTITVKVNKNIKADSHRSVATL